MVKSAPEEFPYEVDSTQAWTADHEKEADLQRKRRRARALHTACANGLAPREAEEGDITLQNVKDYVAESKKHVQQHCTQKQREAAKQKLNETSMATLLHGKRVHISSLRPVQNDLLDRYMETMRCHYEDNPAQADVFVVEDVLRPSETLLWHAMLAGGLISSFQAFLNQNGVALQYKPCMQVRRSVFLSDAFQQENSGFSDVITGRMLRHSDTCNWTLLSGMPDFIRRLQVQRRTSRADSELLAFVSEAESKSLGGVLTAQPDFRGKLGCKLLTARAAVEFLAKIHIKKQGLCSK